MDTKIDSDTTELLAKTAMGFQTLSVGAEYKEAALINIQKWLDLPPYQEYKEQIVDIIKKDKWDLLLDSFYQVIPFGTGGRRGLVGIGPNRINTDTIESSAEGHSQYLLNKFGQEAKTRGVVISYDVRQYLKKGVYNDDLPNPIMGMSCKELAIKAACIYSANGIKVYLFSDFTTTPEMSFMVRELHAVAGDMISASHNPPEFNGKKVVDETGGQLLPPLDEELVDMVIHGEKEIKYMDFDKAVEQKLIIYVSEEQHQKYLTACKTVSINSTFRSAKILFSPFHGTAFSSVYPVLSQLDFDIVMDKASGKPDPKFSSIIFNIPNPEVEEAYINLIKPAEEVNADIIITADPDGDRIGLMSKEKTGWHFYNGNEIFILAVIYLLEEFQRQGKLSPQKVLIKTLVTSNLIEIFAKEFNVKIISDLLVGIKYVAKEINKLEKSGHIDDFLIGGEESNGMTAGGYVYDKDTCVPAILISELASREKDKSRTLLEYLHDIDRKYGYFRNYLTEIRLLGADGMSKMAIIQAYLREQKPKTMGDFEITSIKDYWQGKPFLSNTDKFSRNVLVFNFKTGDKTCNMTVTIRPSGTEPKTKIYLEIGRFPIAEDADLEAEIAEVERLKEKLEKTVIKYLCKIIGIDFPDRGFLLFWQLPITDKMHYFEIEPEIVSLAQEMEPVIRQEKLDKLLKFLGSDPIAKVDRAFKAEYQKGIREFLQLTNF